MKSDVNELQMEPVATSAGTTEKRFASWFLLLAALVFIVVVWGAIVRLTGSGLSIPEWPIINGSPLPPLTHDDWLAVYKTYYLEVHNVTDIQASGVMPLGEFQTMFAIEYIHRSIAAVVGILFLALFVQTLRHDVLRRNVGAILTIALVMLVAQVFLGAVVVKQELRAELVSLHLAAAYLFFGLILWSYLKLSQSPRTFGQTQTLIAQMSSSKNLSVAAWFTAVVLLAQIISGGLMAGSGAGYTLNTFPKIGNVWVPAASILVSESYGGFVANLFRNQVLIQFIHRWWVLAVIVGIALVHVASMKRNLPPRGRLAVMAACTVLVLQLLLGIGNLVMKVPFFLSAIHSATALVLFALILIVTYESRFERGIADA